MSDNLRSRPKKTHVSYADAPVGEGVKCSDSLSTWEVVPARACSSLGTRRGTGSTPRLRFLVQNKQPCPNRLGVHTTGVAWCRWRWRLMRCPTGHGCFKGGRQGTHPSLPLFPSPVFEPLPLHFHSRRNSKIRSSPRPRPGFPASPPFRARESRCRQSERMRTKPGFAVVHFLEFQLATCTSTPPGSPGPPLGFPFSPLHP